MIRTRLRCEAIRTYGSGKLRGDPEITPASAAFPPATISKTWSPGPLTNHPTLILGALPVRIGLHKPVALG